MRTSLVNTHNQDVDNTGMKALKRSLDKGMFSHKVKLTLVPIFVIII